MKKLNISSAVSLFYSRIVFKKLDDSARILWNVEKTLKNAVKLRADTNFLKNIRCILFICLLYFTYFEK